MSNWEAFVEDQEYVIGEFKKGFFDYLESASKVVEAEFFRHFLEGGHFERLAESYPTPRKKEEVPLWVYLCSQVTLRLHGASGYESMPYHLHCGGLVDALGPKEVQYKADPETGRRRLSFRGHNQKNYYDRAAPCDPDYVRKLARDTEKEDLQAWFSSAMNPLYRDLNAFDPEGIFMVDGSYLFVPDNKKYEESTVLCFDEHNHPISKEGRKKLTEVQQRRCRFRRCYRSVNLIHTDPELRYTLYNGVQLLPGKASETPCLGPLVDDFVRSVGPGIMKWLVFDRGFIDGPTISRIKSDYGVDCLFPLKKGMLDLEDAKVLAETDGQPWKKWTPAAKAAPPEPEGRPEPIRRREKSRQRTLAEKKTNRPEPDRPCLEFVEMKAIRDMRLWETCSVPISVILMRDHMSDGKVREWSLATTSRGIEAVKARDLYKLRPHHEESYRQMKCFWDLTSFRSTRLSLISAQIVFVLLAYSLMQLFLIRTERGDYTRKTREKLLERLLPEGGKIVIYRDNRVAYLRPIEHQDLVLNLDEGPRRRMIGKTRELIRKYVEPPELPLRPSEG
jgi:hypothetical protein